MCDGGASRGSAVTPSLICKAAAEGSSPSVSTPSGLLAGGGSGACVVAATPLRDAGRGEGTVAVDVPGGRLTITFDGDECRLAGPAVVVATGEIDLGALIPGV